MDKQLEAIGGNKPSKIRNSLRIQLQEQKRVWKPEGKWAGNPTMIRNKETISTEEKLGPG